jgi:hypothetical protein
VKDPIAALEWHPGPGAEELVRRKAQLQVLTRRLLERERGLAAYRNELAAFETRYRKALGTRYARLDELAERLDETRDADRDPLDPEQEPERRAPVGDEAKRLFRQLARLIHPDLAGDAAERERRTNLMVAANDAYEQGDVAALERLLADWHASPEAVTGSGAAAELERTIRRIAQVEAQMRHIEDELAELEASAMGWLRRRVEKAAREGWDLLAHMVRELDRQISEAQLELERRIPLRSHG